MQVSRAYSRIILLLWPCDRRSLPFLLRQSREGIVFGTYPPTRIVCFGCRPQDYAAGLCGQHMADVEVNVATVKTFVTGTSAYIPVTCQYGTCIVQGVISSYRGWSWSMKQIDHCHLRCYTLLPCFVKRCVQQCTNAAVITTISTNSLNIYRVHCTKS